MKILADSNIPFAAEAFASFGSVTTLSGRRIDRAAIEGAGMLLVRSGTTVDETLLTGSSVRFVGTATIGTEHVDREWLAANSIGFASAPGSNADSVADYVVSALLHLSFVKNWPLAGKTIGIVGVGNVGSRIFRRAEAMGLKVIVCDPPKARLTVSDFYRPLNELLAVSDIVTLHVPLITTGDDATVGMAGRDFFNRMKPGSVFINTCRGKVTDEKALREARGRLAGVVLDVWESEPAPDPETIRIADIATPHIAGHSWDGKVAGTRMIYNAACAYFFSDRTWTGLSAFSGVDDITLSFPRVDVSLYDVVSRAYPIMDDDLRFREILTKPADEVSAFFDSLRVNYPRRLEFTHFCVDAQAVTPLKRSALEILGFRIAAATPDVFTPLHSGVASPFASAVDGNADPA